MLWLLYLSLALCAQKPPANAREQACSSPSGDVDAINRQSHVVHSGIASVYFVYSGRFPTVMLKCRQALNAVTTYHVYLLDQMVLHTRYMHLSSHLVVPFENLQVFVNLNLMTGQVSYHAFADVPTGMLWYQDCLVALCGTTLHSCHASVFQKATHSYSFSEWHGLLHVSMFLEAEDRHSHKRKAVPYIRLPLAEAGTLYRHSIATKAYVYRFSCPVAFADWLLVNGHTYCVSFDEGGRLLYDAEGTAAADPPPFEGLHQGLQAMVRRKCVSYHRAPFGDRYGALWARFAASASPSFDAYLEALPGLFAFLTDTDQLFFHRAFSHCVDVNLAICADSALFASHLRHGLERIHPAFRRSLDSQDLYALLFEELCDKHSLSGAELLAQLRTKYRRPVPEGFMLFASQIVALGAASCPSTVALHIDAAFKVGTVFVLLTYNMPREPMLEIHIPDCCASPRYTVELTHLCCPHLFAPIDVRECDGCLFVFLSTARGLEVVVVCSARLCLLQGCAPCSTHPWLAHVAHRAAPTLLLAGMYTVYYATDTRLLLGDGRFSVYVDAASLSIHVSLRGGNQYVNELNELVRIFE